MAGFSITTLLLPNSSDKSAPSSELLLSLLDDTPVASGWKYVATAPPPAQIAAPKQAAASAASTVASAHKIALTDSKAFSAAVERACKGLIKAEPEITHMDTIAGDGDCGLTLKSGAEGAWASTAISGLRLRTGTKLTWRSCLLVAFD